MRSPSWRSGLWTAVLLVLGPAPAVAQPVIVFDYSLDTNNFFADQARRDVLQAAAVRLTNRLSDNLSAITPSGSNTWTPQVFHPATGSFVSVPSFSLPQHQIRVFAGGRDLPGSTLGQGGPGGWSAGGNQAWFNLIRGRGQAGALLTTPTDFGPWGGSITFDTVTNWNFSITNNPGGGQSDFLSVAEHELGHLLGFGTADSWDALIGPGTQFNGPKSLALVPGVQTNANLDHWANNTSYLGQQAAMTPSITIGTRKEFNELDYAGLDDLGWDVTPIPEPTTVVGVAALGLAGAWRVRRKVKRTAA